MIILLNYTLETESILFLKSSIDSFDKLTDNFNLILYHALLLVDTFFSGNTVEYNRLLIYFEEEGAFKSKAEKDIEFAINETKNELSNYGKLVTDELKKMNFQMEFFGSELRKVNNNLSSILVAVNSLEETLSTQMKSLQNDLSASINNLDKRLIGNLKTISSRIDTGNFINLIQSIQLKNIKRNLM